MRNEENEDCSKLNPQSSIHDPVLMQRMRWRCRRGLLELDIVLARFVDTRYLQLNEIERRAFESLLDLSDHALWDMIARRREAPDGEQQAVLEIIRTA